MIETLTPYDAAEDLLSDDAIAEFLADAFETCDQAYIAHALGVAARAKGMLDVARKTGLARPQLYRSLSGEGNPTLRSLLAVLDAMGLNLTVKSRASQVEA